jgi:hypothetical protein
VRILALICQTPAKPGAAPLNVTGAVSPPMVTVGWKYGDGKYEMRSYEKNRLKGPRKSTA